MEKGLILFAHGGRTERWSAPFRAILAKVKDSTSAPVELAFLELMRPSLDEAVGTLVAQGVHVIHVVPLFLGEGTHLREDLPRQVEALSRQHPQVTFEVAVAAGEAAPVQAALAAYCMDQLGRNST